MTHCEGLAASASWDPGVPRGLTSGASTTLGTLLHFTDGPRSLLSHGELGAPIPQPQVALSGLCEDRAESHQVSSGGAQAALPPSLGEGLWTQGPHPSDGCLLRAPQT